MGKFKKGNPGKPKGAKNKAAGKLRETITNFLEDNFHLIKADFKKLAPKERSRLYCDLLQYGVPKLQSVANTHDWENMPDEMLDKIIEGLKQAASNE